MRSENFKSESNHTIETEAGVESYESIVSNIYEEIETELEKNEFNLADQSFVSQILSNNSLYCRNESLTKMLEFLGTHEPLNIYNKRGAANICSMSSGDGFRTAMLEGISKIPRDKFVKVVISFKGDHLKSRDKIDADNDLWESKPETARVSLSGDGSIMIEDIEMISVRYPVPYFPENKFNDSEKERLEEADISFIVRHYTPTKKKVTH